MMMGDFLTLMQYDLPVKVVVYNNGSLGMVKLEQNVAGLRDFGTDLMNPDLARVAEAMGAKGVRVEDPSEVKPALEKVRPQASSTLLDEPTILRSLSMHQNV